MNELMDKLIKLPRNQRIGLVVILYVIVAALFWYLLYAPATKKVSTGLAAQGKLNKELVELKAIKAEGDEFKKRVDSLDLELTKALTELPNRSEIGDLLRAISTVGRNTGLEFLLFEPLKEEPKEFYAEVPVRIEVTGTYHEVAMFFDLVGKLPRIVNISNIQMSAPTQKGSTVLLKTAGRATTYRFLDPSEIKPTKAVKGGKGKAAAKEGGAK